MFRTDKDDRCGICRFFENHMQCRRHAPVVALTASGLSSFYPTTFEREWCGDFERKMEAK